VRRLLLLIATATVAALALVGCGSDDDTAQNPMHDRSGMPAHGDRMPAHGRPRHGETSPVAEGAREIEVAARSFEFDPDEIRASVGEDLAIVLTSEDIEHDFQIDELDAHIPVRSGGTNTGGFNAGEAGRYTFWCTVDGHLEAGMEGTLVVE
jgi:cytochrome c oxidase subunit II